MHDKKARRSTEDENIDDVESFTEELENEIRAKQSNARKHKSVVERKKSHETAVNRIVAAASRETCDFFSNPIANLKGEICGSHYKVLGLNRRRQLDKASLKKSYRLQSLAVHPDKNPSHNAQKAFKIVQDAYTCLSDDTCKDSYDEQLKYEETKLALHRHTLKMQILEKGFNAFAKFWHHFSVASAQVYQTGNNVWDWAGEWSISIFDEDWKIGRHLLLGLLLYKGRFFLYAYGVAFAVIRTNYEMLKRR